MNSPLVSALLQMFELAVVFALVVGVAYVMKSMFSIDLSQHVEATAVLVMTGLSKFARASDAIPVADWVNEPLKK